MKILELFAAKQGGTTGQSGNYERSMMPEELCLEIIIDTEKKF